MHPVIMSARVYNLARTKPLRRRLRKNATPQEQVLWARLRDRQTGFKFRRQHGIGGYVADFYCPERKLVVEIDGSQHHETDAVSYDMERTRFFESLGNRVVRFTNAGINTNIEGVLMSICAALSDPSPQPSPR